MAASKGAGQRARAEEPTQLPLNTPGSCGEQRPNGAGHPHEDERDSNRRFRADTYDIDEEWHGQDPATPAEKAQDRTGEQREEPARTSACMGVPRQRGQPSMWRSISRQTS